MAGFVQSNEKVLPLLRVQGISKSFNGVVALKSIDIDLFPGEILGLIGDNGAGKSTLIKILSGAHLPDSGRLFICGCPVDFKTFDVGSARHLGIETVFQDRSLGDKQPLWRNIFAGRPIVNRLGFIRVAAQKRRTMEIMSRYVGLSGAGISADARVRQLSGGERQGLVIGRAMHFKSRIIILDEPTTALSLQEADKVLAFVTHSVGKDSGCIYISHNMSHVHRVVHRIILLDKGTIAGQYWTKDISIEQLVAKMIQLQTIPQENRS